MKLFKTFRHDESGAALVEYATALVVVTLIGAAVISLGDNLTGALCVSAEGMGAQPCP